MYVSKAITTPMSYKYLQKSIAVCHDYVHLSLSVTSVSHAGLGDRYMCIIYLGNNDTVNVHVHVFDDMHIFKNLLHNQIITNFTGKGTQYCFRPFNTTKKQGLFSDQNILVHWAMF